MSTAEYDRIQAQIRALKVELGSSGLPEELRKLREQIRPYPAWVVNFDWPMHPLVSGIETTDDYNSTVFTFNGVKYEMTFERGRPSYPNRDLTEITGKLIVKADGVLVLDSRFFGESHEHGDTYRYHDSDTYKKGPWVQDLLRFKKESNQLIEAARAQSDLAQKRDPALLKAMREKFSIPETPLAASETPKSKNAKKLFGEFLRALFKR